ncbi:MAG TPA: hypothetical protein VFY40_25805, partial [Blastocatellia bacterium]|nr:hypothetical protein [Blastocatellia bacterium]
MIDSINLASYRRKTFDLNREKTEEITVWSIIINALELSAEHANQYNQHISHHRKGKQNMYKHFILLALSIALISSFVLAGVTPQKGKARVEAGKVKEARVKTTDPSGCPSPRPRNRGCSVAC